MAFFRLVGGKVDDNPIVSTFMRRPKIEYCICNVISYNYYSSETLINQSNSNSKFDVKSLVVYKEVLNCVFMYLELIRIKIYVG